MVAENPWPGLFHFAVCVKTNYWPSLDIPFLQTFQPKRKSNLHSSCDIRDGQPREAMGGLTPRPPQSEPRVIFIFNVRH